MSRTLLSRGRIAPAIILVRVDLSRANGGRCDGSPRPVWSPGASSWRRSSELPGARGARVIHAGPRKTGSGAWVRPGTSSTETSADLNAVAWLPLVGAVQLG